MRKMNYPGSAADDRIRRYVPPVRVIRKSDNIENAESLLGVVRTQSYLHYNPPQCLIPPGRFTG